MKTRGFTLIELLVVVAIIALLMGLLAPGLSGAKAQAQKTKCAANLQQISVAMYSYWTEWNARVPCVESPMVNNYFGEKKKTDAECDPFDREKWPMSLPNVLMPTYLGQQSGVFACPSATIGWPKWSKPLRYSYRDAGRNQPNGKVTAPGSYEREHFGFMDGRFLQKFRMDLIAEPNGPNEIIHNAEEFAKSRGIYVRDLVRKVGDELIGPHRGGTMNINRDLQVEFRNRKVTSEDLSPENATVQF